VLGPVAASRGYPTVFAAAGAVTALGALLLSTSRTLREPAEVVSVVATAVSLAPGARHVR
jgi:hypothetical protein